MRARFWTLGSRIRLPPAARRLLESPLALGGGKRHQQGMDSRVVGELGVKGAEQDTSLAHGDGASVDARQHLDLGAMLLDPRRPDEDGAQRVRAQALDLKLRLEARDLTPEGVATRARIDQAEVVPVADDHPGAGAQDRPPLLEMSADRRLEAVALDRLHDRGALAAGYHEAVELPQLRRRPDLDRLGAERSQHLGVLGEVALAGQHANAES